MLQSINPATGLEIARYATLTPSQLEEKLEKAQKTFALWRRSSLTERTQLLHNLALAYSAHKHRLAHMVTAEMGKTYTSAIAEVDKCIAAFHFYAQSGPDMLQTTRFSLAAGASVALYWKSLGPILAIMPWNFPLWQTVRFLAPTILAGNVGLLKHASNVQGVAGLMEELMVVAGAHDGIFQNIAITSERVADVIADTRISAVTLTGSEKAGSAVAQQAGRYLKKVVLELGGSDPFIVMPSASLDKAVSQAVRTRTQNTGQSCICGKRIIVHKDIYTPFLDAFSAAMEAVKAGDPMNEAMDMGPLSSLKQRTIVLDQIKEGEKSGCLLLMGGKAHNGSGAYISAGILTGAPLDSPFVNEEIFGPIAMLYCAEDIDHAIHIANKVPFGLGASVWTQDSLEQEQFINDVESGMVAINQMLVSSPEMPFGGIKRSGHGRELGSFGVHEFMNLKTVLNP